MLFNIIFINGSFWLTP
jgi:CTP synthase (UTP-ammonia lyase)